MFDLFGAEMPLAVRFFLAFLIVLGLIGAAAWAVRRFGSARLGGVVRGRQPRLAVIEYATVDARRRLLLVRRDNIEHLVMIGGPSDVVVESNIVRAMPASREPALPRMSPQADPLPRPIPLPEATSNGSWPLQPEPPAAPARRAPRVEPIPEEQTMAPPPHPEPPPRPQREVLTALADDLAGHTPPPAPPITPLPPRNRPPAPPRLTPTEIRSEPRAEPRAPVMQPAMQPALQSALQPTLEPAAVDQSLAEMAQRLEAALRKPKAAESRTPAAAPAASAEPHEEVDETASSAPPPRPARPAEAKPARADARPKEGKALYDSLEQEMASLLGRPPNKT